MLIVCIFYHTYVTIFFQNQCHVIYIYIVRLVHTCTKYWPLRGFENKLKTIASRNQGIIIIQLPSHPSVKKNTKETLSKWTYGTLESIAFWSSQPRIHPNSHDQIALLTLGGTLVVNILCK
jgi:hypothetical protein